MGTSAILYSKRAACKSKLGDLKSSIDDATNSLKLKPMVDSYLIRANAHNDLERYITHFNSVSTCMILYFLFTCLLNSLKLVFTVAFIYN